MENIATGRYKPKRVYKVDREVHGSKGHKG